MKSNHRVVKNREFLSTVRHDQQADEYNKPTLITFDGFNGSGKSVQMVMLKRKIRELQQVEAHIPEQKNHHVDIVQLLYHAKRLLSIGHRNSMVNVIHRIYTIKVAQRDTDQWQRDGYVLADWFWDMIIEFGIDDSVLSAFRALLRAYNGYEPIVSIYMYVPSHERRRRLFMRNARLRDKNPEKYGRMEWIDSDEDNKTDARWLKAAEWLAKEVPYFHVIDGMPSEDIVQAQVMSILKTNCHEIGVTL